MARTRKFSSRTKDSALDHPATAARRKWSNQNLYLHMQFYFSILLTNYKPDWIPFFSRSPQVYVNSSCLGIKTDFTVKQLYTIFTVNIYSICSCKITNFTVKSQYSISTVNFYSKISCKNTEIFNSDMTGLKFVNW